MKTQDLVELMNKDILSAEGARMLCTKAKAKVILEELEMIEDTIIEQAEVGDYYAVVRVGCPHSKDVVQILIDKGYEALLDESNYVIRWSEQDTNI